MSKQMMSSVEKPDSILADLQYGNLKVSRFHEVKTRDDVNKLHQYL